MKLTINDVREYAAMYHVMLKSRETLEKYYTSNTTTDEQIDAALKEVEQNQENELSKLSEITEALNE